MANTSLPNLTERTATANTDLIHVNSGGTDYKETKGNFLSDVNSSITSLNNGLSDANAEITSLNNSLANKQNDLGLTLVYYGNIPSNSSYSMSGSANQVYFVVFGTWNFRKICFVDPANGNAPRVTNIGEASNLLTVTANGTWGLTFNNGTNYSMPLIIRRLN